MFALNKNELRIPMALGLILLLADLPVLGAPVGGAELIGVAKASGQVEINGLPLPGESNVYSGDRVSTGEQSTLMLISGPQERIQLAPESSVRLRKQGETTVIVLEQGAVYFRSAGRTWAVIEAFGLEIRTGSGSDSIAHVALGNPQQAQVSALRGSVEIRGEGQSVVLQPGQSALVTQEEAQEDEEEKRKEKKEYKPGELRGAGAEKAKRDLRRKKILAIVLVPLTVAAAITLPIVLNEKDPVSPSVP
jgi:hypothetical protein